MTKEEYDEFKLKTDTYNKLKYEAYEIQSILSSLGTTSDVDKISLILPKDYVTVIIPESCRAAIKESIKLILMERSKRIDKEMEEL